MKDIKKILVRIERAIPPDVDNPELWARKIRLARIILLIRRRHRKKFGLFVVFGWKRRWDELYANVPDSSQDIFVNSRRNIFNEKSIRRITDTVDFDGAILIDKNGIILHSGIILEGLRPRLLAARLKLANASADLSSKLGFEKKVHARHLSAIASSWEFKGTTVYTVSEETGDMHIFENGRIVFSTVRDENRPL